MYRVIEDKELGRLVVRDNVRAKRLVFRTKADAIYISIPLGVTMREVKEAIEKLRPRLLDSRQKLVRPLIDLNYRIETEYFKLSLVSGKRERFLAHSELGEMRIICPPTADFTDSNLQDWLRKVIEEAYRLGCLFDSWTESFRDDLWEKAFLNTGIEKEFYTLRTRDKNELFPWDFIDTGVSRKFLRKEWERAMNAEVTPNCREHCSGCGASKFGGGVCYEGKN